MRDFSNDNKFSGSRGRSFGGDSRRSFGSRDSGRNSMHDAICDQCGAACKVPFVPSNGKPIFCSDCFEKKDHGDRDSSRSRGNFDRPSFDRPRFQDRERRPFTSPVYNPESDNKKFDIITAKLDKILKILTSDSPAIKPKKASKKAVEAEVAALVEEVSAETPGVVTE